MSKFKKRIAKIVDKLDNAIVYGRAFNKLPEIADMFNTIFVITDNPLSFRGKNIVYVPNLNGFTESISISVTFIDKDKTNDLSVLRPIFSQSKSIILIEGTEVIGRDKSELLYKYGFRAISQQKNFHVWKQQ